MPKEPSLRVVEPVVDPVAEEDDSKYFYLSKPIQAGEKTLERLLLDPIGLSGRKYFELTKRFRAEYPETFRSSFNKNSEEEFISLVIAELNEIAPQDLYKIPFNELPLLFLRASSFLYSGGVKKA